MNKIKLASIKNNPNNPRIIKDDKFVKLCDSIKDMPAMMALRPIVVNEENIVLGGNMRLKALQHLGYKEIPEEWVKSAGELTDEQKRKFIILDNVSGGEWDYSILATEWELKELEDLGLDVDYGKFEKNIDRETGDVPEVVAPSKKLLEKWGVGLGDLWQLGKHRIICGSSAESSVVETVLRQDKPTLIFTDPPYGVSIGDKNKMLNEFSKHNRVVENIESDTMSVPELKAMLLKVFTLCKKHMADDCSVFVCSPQGGGLGMMMMMMQESCLEVRHILNWIKNSSTFSMGRLDYDYQHEPILFTWGKKHKKIMAGEFKTSLWTCDKPRACDLHPTMKPIELYLNAILNHTDTNDIVYEPFSGSGTSILACEKTDRICRAIELDPQYVAVAIERWTEMSGQKPEKIYGTT